MMNCCNNPCPPPPGNCFPSPTKGHSFQWREYWKAGVYYYNDDYITDFVTYNNVMLACRRNHLSDVNTEPIIIYDGGVPVGVDSMYWSFVIAGSESSVNWSDLVFNIDGDTLSYSTDGGTTFTEIGQVSIPIVDNLDSTATDQALSANQGHVLKGMIEGIDSGVTSITMNGEVMPETTTGGVDLGTVITSETQSDWNVSNSNSAAYIKNKPTIPAEVTEQTVSNWGFTKNLGTVTVANTSSTTTSDVDLSGVVGILNTTNATALSPVADESLSNTVNLHKISKTGNLGDLTNVTISSPSTDQVLLYDGTGWVNAASPGGGGGATSLDGLSDVELTSPVNGNVLTYNGSDWVNSNVGALNYQKVTSSEYANMQLVDNILYIIVD